MSKKKTEQPNGFTDKVTGFIGKNKQLFIGLAIGALIMLPTGLYVNERNSNRQADQGNTTLETKADNDSGQAKTVAPVTGQPTTQNSSQSSTSSGSNKPSSNYTPTTTPTSTYKAPVCTKTPTPYKTFIKIASYLGTGETTINGGSEGYTETCTADSTGYVPYKVPLNPVDKYIYVGTGGITATTTPRTSPPEADQLDRIKADCSMQLAKHGNQEAYQLCVSTLARYFNIPL
jgi:hypothetical protein